MLRQLLRRVSHGSRMTLTLSNAARVRRARRIDRSIERIRVTDASVTVIVGSTTTATSASVRRRWHVGLLGRGDRRWLELRGARQDEHVHGHHVGHGRGVGFRLDGVCVW